MTLASILKISLCVYWYLTLKLLLKHHDDYCDHHNHDNHTNDPTDDSIHKLFLHYCLLNMSLGIWVVIGCHCCTMVTTTIINNYVYT